MGVYQKLVDFDTAFRRSQGKSPIVLNDVEAFSQYDVDKLNRLLSTTYSGDMLTNIPTCDCENITGAYNIGVRCPRCGTEVQPILNVDLQPKTWIRSPKGVAKLINPQVWLMLKKQFSIGNFNLILWLADRTYRPQINEPPILREIEQIQIAGKPISRGYNYFVRNFWEILDALFSIKKINSKAKSTGKTLRAVLHKQKNCVFSDYIPMPHRSMLVVEDTYSGSYVDEFTPEAKDAILNMAGVDSEIHGFSVEIKEGRTARFIDKYAAFFEKTYQEVIAKKEGLIRKHAIAARSHWSFRAVITSITNRHRNDEIYIPWGVATSVFRTHIIALLMQRGYTPDEIIKFLNDHAEKYHPLLDELFQEIIRNAPSGRGVAATMNRNPSLQRGSILRVYISRVKIDVGDNTVSMSILATKTLNADYDGDALQFTLLIDQEQERKFEMFAPYQNAFGLGEPRTISKAPSMPNPVLATIANYIEADSGPPDPEKLQIMKQLFLA